MNGICKILGILLFIRAFICASAGCEPNCTLDEAQMICLKQLGPMDRCRQQCEWEKGGWLDESGYLKTEALNQTYKYPETAKVFTEINWMCWEGIYGNGTVTDLCGAATQFKSCVNFLGYMAIDGDTLEY